MAKDREQHGESCFTHLWDMTEPKCVMCSDNEMCGIMFHKRQKKTVKLMEAGMAATMDLVDFDSISREELLLWLKSKPRRTGELVERVAELSKCTEPDTVRFWVISFIKEHPKLKVEKNIVVVLK